jgi:type IV pilus assembly protein PilA
MNIFTSKALLKKLRTKRKANGFTLIELMVVVAIVGVLSSVGLPQLLKAQDKAKDSAAIATLTNAAKECSLLLVTEGNGDNFDIAQYTAGGNTVSGECKADTADTLTILSASGDGTKVASVSFDVGGIPGIADFTGATAAVTPAPQ